MENFDLNKKVREQRGKETSFIGTADKVKEPVPTKTQPPQKSKKPKENPVEALKKNVEESKDVPKETKTEKDSVTLVKGFSVGVTEDGFVKLAPFGKPSKLEMVGFSEYVKVKMEDLLQQIGHTYAISKFDVIKDLSDGITTVAQGVNELLKKV